MATEHDATSWRDAVKATVLEGAESARPEAESTRKWLRELPVLLDELAARCCDLWTCCRKALRGDSGPLERG
jgi:hypothetical protein